MKTSSITAISGFLSVVLAQHNHNHARHHHEKRNVVSVWETEYEVVTETVAITTTITIDPKAPTTTAVGTTPIAASSASDSPGVFIIVSSTSTPIAVAPTTSSTPTVIVEPTSTTPVAIVEPTSTTPIAVPATTFSSVFVAPPAPATPTTSSSIFIAPTTSVAAAVPTPATSTSESNSNLPTTQCNEGDPCSGDLTFYTTGEGACGWTNDGTVENIVALSYLLMGPESNDGEGGMNPFCGKTITVEFQGKTTTALVVDKCMGCDMLSIDLSDKAFSDVADMALGRVQGTWFFNE